MVRAGLPSGSKKEPDVPSGNFYLMTGHFHEKAGAKTIPGGNSPTVQESDRFRETRSTSETANPERAGTDANFTRGIRIELLRVSNDSNNTLDKFPQPDFWIAGLKLPTAQMVKFRPNGTNFLELRQSRAILDIKRTDHIAICLDSTMGDALRMQLLAV